MITAELTDTIGQLEWKLIVTIQALFDFNAGNIILSIPWKVSSNQRACNISIAHDQLLVCPCLNSAKVRMTLSRLH